MTKSFKDALSRSGGISKTNNLRVNPFDLKVNKSKFEVLNRSDRGTRGNVTVSRTRAAAVRKATILPQLQEKSRAHASTFIDRRFGVRGEGTNLSSEEVMQERFAREQQRLVKKQSRKSKKFDLNSLDEVDGDQTGESLTHGGRFISQMNDEELETFDETLEDFDDSSVPVAYNERFRSGQLDGEFVKAGHFGGGGGGGEKKSKQDVMKELIAKSKFYKHERQKLKEENEAMCDDVNQVFASLRGTLKPREVTPRINNTEDANEDDYESVLKALAFDPRSKPTDRTLTGEESEARDKKRLDEQQKALLDRMREGGDGDGDDATGDYTNSNNNSNNTTVIDPELKKIADRQGKLLREFCHSGSPKSYQGIVDYAVKQPRTMIQLGRTIRADLGKLAASFTKRSNASGRGAVMPTLGPIRLLLLVTRVFSCSDYHHVVATPAQLLLAYYLAVGRMTKTEHVQRALALIYCALEFQKIGRRCIPEALQVLYTILNAACSGKKPHTAHYFCRPLGRSLSLSLSSSLSSSLSQKKRGESESFARLFARLFDSSQVLGMDELLDFAVELTVQTFTNLRDGAYPALKEAIQPFLRLLPNNPHLSQLHVSSVPSKSLQLQAHKPLSLPLLNPDFAADYSLEHRKRNGTANGDDEQSISRLKRAHKREFKGAVRELKRDASFLAHHKIKETRRKDSEYKNKMNRIIGSIGNGN
jgi:hypothetical protein